MITAELIAPIVGMVTTLIAKLIEEYIEERKKEKKKVKIKDVFLKIIPDWQNILGLSKNRLFKLSYLWIIIVPILAKVLFSANEISNNALKVFYNGWTFDIGVPFSWNIFYFAALLFVMGNVIFYLRCPTIIKKYNDFSDFVKQENTNFTIYNSVLKNCDLEKEKKEYLNRIYYYLKFEPNIEEPDDEELRKFKVALMTEHKERLADIFSISLDYTGKLRIWSRITVSLFYIFSIVFYVSIIIEQSVFVFETFSRIYLK